MRFQTVRLDALKQLRRGLYTAYGNPRPCVWQKYAQSAHDALYCNVLSHLQALEDLLNDGLWCDQVLLGSDFTLDDDVEGLFRYYGLAFLAFEECVADLRLVRGAAAPGQSGRKAKVEEGAEVYMDYINHVWKHRGQNGRAAAFHRVHHHGPYLFADHPRYREALPADGNYVAMGHSTPQYVAAPVSLVVPSLTGGMRALGGVLLATSKLLRNDPHARQRVRSVYGTATF